MCHLFLGIVSLHGTQLIGGAAAVSRAAPQEQAKVATGERSEPVETVRHETRPGGAHERPFHPQSDASAPSGRNFPTSQFPRVPCGHPWLPSGDPSDRVHQITAARGRLIPTRIYYLEVKCVLPCICRDFSCPRAAVSA